MIHAYESVVPAAAELFQHVLAGKTENHCREILFTVDREKIVRLGLDTMQDQTSYLRESSLPEILWNERIYHPHSFADPDGRVFLWEGRLYRGIFPAAAPFFRTLVENGIISNLVEQRLLVDTELTQITSDEFSLVFQHRFVPFASYPQEWCPLMLKDAALGIIDLVTELAHDQLTLKDGHPWNVLFDAYKPVYIDLGSITPANGSSIWPAYPDFCHYCLYPLILMSQGYDLMGRLLMCEDRGVREYELFRLVPPLGFRAYFRWPINLVLSYAENYLTSVKNRLLKKGSIPTPSRPRKQSRTQERSLSFLRQIRRLVESIPISTLDSRKRRQERPVSSAPDPLAIQRINNEVILRLLAELHPDSILDVHSGNGSLAKQAASLGVRVVCFEADPGNASRLYSEAKTKSLPILPLVMDVTKPTPARGLGNHWAMAATERFPCDLVLALELMNQPMPRRLGFEKIIDGLSQFSKRWLVLDIPLQQGLSIESCIRLLERRFRTVTKMHSHVEGSTLLFCEKDE